MAQSKRIDDVRQGALALSSRDRLALATELLDNSVARRAGGTRGDAQSETVNPVLLRPSALEELREAIAWYEVRDPKIATAFFVERLVGFTLSNRREVRPTDRSLRRAPCRR
jgi:hypothetical protein